MNGWRKRLYTIIFGSDTPEGKTFDVILIIAILVSTFLVMLESVPYVTSRTGDALKIAEWVFTIIFTVEYVLRVISVPRKLAYVTSFFGIVDLIAILPSYGGLFVGGIQYLIVIRVFRILRVFRVLKLSRYIGGARMLMEAMRQSKEKIIVFLLAVLAQVIFIGSIMYLIEGEANGFTSIPRSIYWAIVTLTTVGYGDITPKTPLGQILSAGVMILGFAIIAVPTGIVISEAQRVRDKEYRTCDRCELRLHDLDARYCKRCGAELPKETARDE